MSDKDKKINISLNLGLPSIPGSISPEVDPLVKLEGNLFKLYATCSACSTKSNNPTRMQKFHGVNVSSQKEKAIEYSGNVVRDAMNYKRNATVTDRISELLSLNRSNVLPLFGWLGKYREKEGIRDLVVKYLGDDFNEESGSLFEQSFEKYMANMLSGKNPAKDILDILCDEGSEELLETFQNIDRNKVVNYVRKIGSDFRSMLGSGEGLTDRISDNMEEMISQCTREKGNCGDYNSGLLKDSQDALEELKKNSRIVFSDLGYALTFGHDVLASVVENLTDEEFSQFRDMGIKYIKDNFSDDESEKKEEPSPEELEGKLEDLLETLGGFAEAIVSEVEKKPKKEGN
jgi:hypothetical protein